MSDVHPRLLWIHQNFVAHREVGNRRAAFLVDELLRAGWNVDIIASDKTYLGGPVELTNDIASRDGLTIHRIASGRGNALSNRGFAYARFMFASLAVLRRLPRPDVVLASIPPLPQIIASIAASLRWNCPVLLETRDLWPAFLEQGGLISSPIVIGLLRWLESISYHFADRHVVVAPAFTDYLCHMGVAQNDIVVLPTGTELLPSIAISQRETQRTALGWGNKLVFFYAGSFNEAYGIDFLIQSVKEVPCAGTIWVFAGDGRGRSLVEEAATSHPHVLYLGALPGNEVRNLMLLADIGVTTHAPWPLLETTISGKIFDYAAAGIPILAIGIGQTAMVIRAALCGWVLDTRTSKAFAECVRRICDLSESERRLKGAAGQAWMASTMPARKLAAVARAELDELSSAQPRNRIGRLIRSALIATSDLLRNRGPTAIRDLFTETREVVIERAFAEWLKRGLICRNID